MRDCAAKDLAADATLQRQRLGTTSESDGADEPLERQGRNLDADFCVGLGST